MLSKEKQTKREVLSSNISQLSKRARITDEQIKICAEMLLKTDLDEKRSESIGRIYSRVCESLGSPTPRQKISICKSICSIVDGTELVTEQSVFGATENVDNAALGKVAYIKNRRNDDAFLLFSKKMRGIKAEYAAGFQDACESVFDDKCEFCMLPIEDDTDGKLYSFYQMIDRYDLKIRHTVRINVDDGRSITFALAARNSGSEVRFSGKVRFEFYVVREGADYVGEVLSAAAALGASIYSVSTVPVEYDDRLCRCYFALDLGAADVIPMALYLSLEYHGYTSLGWYMI